MDGDFRRRAGGGESVRGLGFVTRVGGGRACVVVCEKVGVVSLALFGCEEPVIGTWQGGCVDGVGPSVWGA